MEDNMAKDPAFLFYPGDWLGGTQTFTRAHKGAYMDLLMAQHSAGHMPIHDIQHVLGEKDFKEMWEQKLKSKFEQDSDGLFYNQKLEDEMIKRKKFTDSRKNNLTDKKTHMEQHMDVQMENGNGNINTIENNINVPFSDFWKLYDKKTSPKDKCEKKWEKLKDSERAAAMEYIPEYKVAQPDKQFRKDPETFLNQKAWLNEIIYRDGTNPHIRKPSGVNDGRKKGTSQARTEGLGNWGREAIR
jgi:hypothetical protein